MWPGAAGPCYSGSRCFIGISVGLALVGLPAAAGTTWVPDRSVWAPSVERGGGGNGWADGLTGGAQRAGPAPPTKNFRRAAPRAGLGRFHCHGREPNEAVIEPNPNKLSAWSAPGRPPKGNGANLHNSFTWREAAALLRVSGRTVIHAARVPSEDSPAAPAVRLAVKQGRVTVSDASRVIDEPTEVQLRALERVTGVGPGTSPARRRGCPPGWIAVVAEVIGGAGPTPWRVWRTPARWVSPAGADMGGGAAVVVSGPDGGDGHPGGWLLRAGYRVRPAAVAGGAWHGADGAPGHPIYPLPAARRSTERRRNGFSRLSHSTAGGNNAAENGSPGRELRVRGPGGLIVPGWWRF